MRIRRRRFVAAALALAVMSGTSCIDPLLGPEPDPHDAVHNFDLLWEQFDRHYSFFVLKGIDWEALRDTYRPLVRPTTSDMGLLSIVTDMLDELEDGHVNVFTDQGVYGYIGWYTDQPGSYQPDLVITRLKGTLTRAPGGLLRYGQPEPGIGYVRIPTFVKGMAGDLDAALAALAPLDALIVDLRHNGGGSDGEVREMAGRLVTERRLYRTVRFRNGPEHEDFTPHIPAYVEPRGPAQFTGPVVLLTNRRTFSSAESFVLAARTRAGVTVVGDTTGGGSGNPMYRELPNGWIYRMPRWISYDASGRPFEGVGLAPDRYVTFERESTTDLILEDAIQMLMAQSAGG